MRTKGKNKKETNISLHMYTVFFTTFNKICMRNSKKQRFSKIKIIIINPNMKNKT